LPAPRLAWTLRAQRPLELLGRDHTFRQLDELVPRLAGRCPQTQPADQAVAAAPDLERKGVEPHDGLQRALLEDDGVPHSAFLSRLGGSISTATRPPRRSRASESSAPSGCPSAPHPRTLGWLEGDALPRAYASADIFLFASSTDTFGQVILEAQASGLPVVAVAEGGPRTLIEDGRTGLLRPADAEALADALCELAAAPALRGRLAKAGLETVRGRTWERALERLAEGYRLALGEAGAGEEPAPAPGRSPRAREAAAA
jgi:Glycosyl transferases group 1